MARAEFDRSLATLQIELLALGDMVETAITRALNALKDRDLVASRRIVQDDDQIDQMQSQLEEKCIDLIATQQPIAVDLRTLLAVLHISVELERMGDYAEGIGKISILMGEEPTLKPLIDIPKMAAKSTDMLRRSLEALVNRDEAAALQVCKDDDEVDSLYDLVYHDLLTYMINDRETVKRATFLLWVAHDLERLADRATNVAERVIFLVTGNLKQLGELKQ
jgi:phosphate transport system protein